MSNLTKEQISSLVTVLDSREQRIRGQMDAAAVSRTVSAEREPSDDSDLAKHGTSMAASAVSAGEHAHVLGRGRPAAAHMAANTRSLTAMQVLLKRTMQVPLQAPRSGPVRQDPSGSRVFP